MCAWSLSFVLRQFRQLGAPEVAAGSIKSLFYDLINIFRTDIFARCATLDEPASATVLADFESLVTQVLRVLAQKIIAWDTLPWKLIALAHWNNDVARNCAKKCIELFDRCRKISTPRQARAPPPSSSAPRTTWSFIASFFTFLVYSWCHPRILG